MRWALLLLPLLAGARRRLSLDPCAATAYVLAQGAPLGKGRVFPRQRGYVDYAVDDSGVGAAYVAAMPLCQAQNAWSIKLLNYSALWTAARWIEEECEMRDCVVYTKYALPDLAFAVVN